MATTVDLRKVNERNISEASVSKDREPNTVLVIDTSNESVTKSTGKGTAVTYNGYNTGKPNLNAPWAGQFSLGVATESDNLAFGPSILLDPNSTQHATISHNLVASCADIRLKTFDQIVKNRSIAVSNADIVQHRGNEIIELVVGNSNYRSNGTKIGSSGGVHLIKSGRGELQPMVLGNNLVSALTELTDLVGNLATRIVEIRKDMIILKGYLMAHVHISAVGPTSPSPDLAATLGTSIASDGFEISNTISSTVNLELLKLNHLYGFNAEKILSDDHKLT